MVNDKVIFLCCQEGSTYSFLKICPFFNLVFDYSYKENDKLKEEDYAKQTIYI